jgi:hypothetical protein
MLHVIFAVIRRGTSRTVLGTRRTVLLALTTLTLATGSTLLGTGLLDAGPFDTGPFGASFGTPAGAAAMANSHWTWCNDNAVHNAPKVVWWRIQGATQSNSDIPASYWSDGGYRGDIAKIICYESTYDWHATNGPQYGWYQMNQPLISSENVTWNQYWNGTSQHEAGWYQCLAGERYIKSRYGNPLAAWEHERYYGWY